MAAGPWPGTTAAGCSPTRSWDSRARTTGSTAYEYDANSNVLAQTVIRGKGQPEEHSYTYDDADRLVGWYVSKRLNAAYAYDDAGNRVQAGDAAYTYDARNRMTSGGGSTYTWGSARVR